MPILCHSCQKVCADYGELAKHIASSKQGHRRGKKWAAGYLLHTRSLAQREKLKDQSKGRVALTEEERENKKETVRELSGETTVQPILCPHCHRKSQGIFPIEFGESGNAWRKNDCLVVLCQNCRG